MFPFSFFSDFLLSSFNYFNPIKPTSDEELKENIKGFLIDNQYYIALPEYEKKELIAKIAEKVCEKGWKEDPCCVHMLILGNEYQPENNLDRNKNNSNNYSMNQNNKIYHTQSQDGKLSFFHNFLGAYLYIFLYDDIWKISLDKKQDKMDLRIRKKLKIGKKERWNYACENKLESLCREYKLCKNKRTFWVYERMNDIESNQFYCGLSSNIDSSFYEKVKLIYEENKNFLSDLHLSQISDFLNYKISDLSPKLREILVKLNNIECIKTGSQLLDVYP